MKQKLVLNKITTSNLSDAHARKIFGGDDTTQTYHEDISCGCTEPTGCAESCGNCTDIEQTCAVTKDEASCQNGPATCVC